MNATLRPASFSLLLVLLLMALLPSAPAAEVSTTQPIITSITLADTNLCFSAWFPPGISRAALEMRPTLADLWQEALEVNVSTNGGNLSFTLPRPALDIAFFRLNVTLGTTLQPQLSTEVQYVIVPPLTEVFSNGLPVEAVFHFKGQVDGSDRIRISRSGALWDHVNWGWPDGVTVNGSQWNPADKNYLTTARQIAFLPAGYSLTDATLEVITGRDVVALEKMEDGLLVCLDDTPAGPGPYEFGIHFHRSRSMPAQVHSLTPITLKIAAQIDGSDRLKITAQEATWTHLAWGVPTGVTLNGIAWEPAGNNILPNIGTNRFIPEGVDFSTARIIRRSGRDLATMWADADALWITFADNPNGPDQYELEILLDQREPN